MLAMMPFWSSSRMTVDGLMPALSAKSLTDTVGGISTGAWGAVATAAGASVRGADGRLFWGRRRGPPGLRGGLRCITSSFYYFEIVLLSYCMIASVRDAFAARSGSGS